MSFYISDSLKGRITEETVTNKHEEIRKSNFSEKLYLEIITNTNDNERYCLPIEGIRQEDKTVIIEIGMPDNQILFANTLKISKASNVSMYLTNLNFEESDICIFSFNNNKIELKEVRKSLLGYNYLATIVIHNCVVF